MKNVRLVTPISLFLRALLLGALGVILLRAPNFAAFSLRALLSAALAGFGVLSALSAFRQGRLAWRPLAKAALSLLGAISLWTVPALYRAGASMLFGGWALINGLLNLIYVVQLCITGSKGVLRYGLTGLVSLAFGLLLMLKPVTRAPFSAAVSGIYFLFYGFSVLMEGVEELFNWRDAEENPLLARIRVQPPALLTALIPRRLVDSVNRHIADASGNLVYEKLNETDQGEEVLEVLFHLGKDVAYGFGHTDICYRGEVYSYGCYDEASNRVFGLFSDGTFMVTALKPYLEYCCDVEHKTLVGFFVRLNAQQDEKIARALRGLLDTCVPWEPTQENREVPGSSAHAFRRIPLRFFKLQKGPFRIYNAVKTNCVAMVEMLVNETGVRLLPPNGIITPGSYYAFMENRLADPDSRVTRKVLYNPRLPRP